MRTIRPLVWMVAACVSCSSEDSGSLVAIDAAPAVDAVVGAGVVDDGDASEGPDPYPYSVP